MGWIIGLLGVLVVVVSGGVGYGLFLMERIDARLLDIQVGIKMLREGR